MHVIMLHIMVLAQMSLLLTPCIDHQHCRAVCHVSLLPVGPLLMCGLAMFHSMLISSLSVPVSGLCANEMCACGLLAACRMQAMVWNYNRFQLRVPPHPPDVSTPRITLKNVLPCTTTGYAAADNSKDTTSWKKKVNSQTHYRTPCARGMQMVAVPRTKCNIRASVVGVTVPLVGHVISRPVILGGEIVSKKGERVMFWLILRVCINTPLVCSISYTHTSC